MPLNGTVDSIGASKRKGVSTGVGVGVSSAGVAASFGGAGYIDYGAQSPISSSTPFAIALFERVDGIVDYGSLCGIPTDGGQFIVIRSHDNGTYGYHFAVGGAGGSPRNFDIGSRVVGEVHRFLLTGNSMADTASFRLWMDGVEIPIGATNFGATPAKNLYLGWDGQDGKWNGLIQDFNLWGRKFSEADAKDYFANPYANFKPVSRSLWIPGTASGGGGTSQVYSDANAAYLIRSFAQQDFAASYAIRGAVPSDVAPAYSVRGPVQSDEVASYNLRTSASSDLTPSYSIQNAGTVTIDLSPSYAVRSAAQSDLSAGFALRGAAQSDVASSYTIRASVLSSLSPSYAVAGAISAVQSDLSVSYSVFGVAAACPSAAEVAAAVRSELAAELAQLTKVSKLHGIGVDLVVTPTSRTAGSVAQTISTAGDAVTVSAA